MTQVFTEAGEAVPVTVIQAGPCRVTQVKNADTDGYDAIQIGYGSKRSLTKSLLGHMRDLPAYRWLREFRLDESSAEVERGKEIGVEIFTVGEKVKVVGESKGKGFQGVVRRHGFHGSPASHGHKDQLRMPGSIGATDAARVFKGTKMAGRMGGAQVTVANLEVVKVDPEHNLLYVRGAVPGPRTGFVKVYGPGELQFRVEAAPETDSQPESSEREVEAKQPVENGKTEKTETEEPTEKPAEPVEQKTEAEDVSAEKDASSDTKKETK